MSHLCVMFLLLCCTKVTKTAIPEVVAPLNPVHGVIGEDLILPCYLENSVSAVDMEVQWIINGNQLVHHYRRHMDITDQQLPAYSGRTSLFREELQRGNISLKLRSVRLSDTHTYKCYIKTNEGTEEASFKVQIHELGNEPETSAESHNNGSVTLACKSTNWTIKPSIAWMDGNGKILHARVSEDCVLTGAVLHVQSIVTVQEKHGYNYTCRVSYLDHSKEKMYEVKRSLFARHRHHWVLFLDLFILVFPYIYYLKRMCQEHTGNLIHFKKQVLQDYNTILLKYHPDLYIKPKIIQTVGDDVRHLEHIFSPGDGSTNPEAVPKMVVLQGRSGHGKSFTAQMIVRDWALKPDYLNQFDLVLLLKSEDLNQQMNNSLVEKKLVELVCWHKRFRPMVKKTLMQSPHKVLFIMDGFDELVLSGNGTPPIDYSPFSPASVEDHILALLSGGTLPKSSLLITTRPSALDRLKQLIRQGPIKFTQIMGFSKDNVKQYFEKFSKSTEKNYDLDFVQERKTLSASCCIPGMCSLVCTFIKSEVETSNITDDETVTSIFLQLMISLLKQHYNKDALDGNVLKDLVVLAEGEKLTKNNRRSSKDLSDLKRNPFLCREPPQMQCRFTYRVFQEFFTALGYIIPGVLENVETLLTVKEEEKTLNKNIHRFAVIRFLFGLSNPKISMRYTPNVVDEERMTSLLTFLKNWVCEEMKKKHERYVRLFLLRCLFELHKDDVTQEAMQVMESDTIDLTSTFLNEVDCLVLQYCLQFCPNTRLKLRKCRLTSEELKLLTPVLGNQQQLWLDVEDLQNADVDKLISSLRYGKILRENSEYPELKVEIRLSAVKNLISETAANLMDTFLKSKNNSFVSIKVAQENSDVLPVCSSILVKTDKDYTVLDVKDLADADSLISQLNGNVLREHSDPEPKVEIRLSTVKNPSSKTAVQLIDTLLKSKRDVSVSIKVAEEKDTDVHPSVCSSMSVKKDKDSFQLEVKDLEDADVDDLISSLRDGNILREHSPAETKSHVEIRLSAVKNLTSITAANLIHTFLMSKRDAFVSIEVAEEKNTDVRPSVCSSILVNKDKDSFGVQVECKPQQSGGVPTVSLMSLTMTPPEDPLAVSTGSDSRVIWTDIMTSLSSQENVITDLQQCLHQLCNLKKTSITVNDPIQNESDEMFSQLLKKCPELIDFSFVRKVTSSEKRDQQISLSLKKEKYSRFRLQVSGYSTEISIILAERPGPSQVTDLLSKVQSLGNVTDDLDKGMDALLSSMSTLRVVKDMTLIVKCLKESWVNGVIRLMQNSPTLQDVKLMAYQQKNTENICSSLLLKKLDNSCLMVTANCSSKISNVSLMLPPTDPAASMKTISECTKIVRQMHASEEAKEINVELDNIVHNLLSLPWLEYVNLRVSRLTHIWTNRILSAIRNRKENIKMDMSSDQDDAESLCSAISVDRDGATLRLTANNWMVYKEIQKACALSHISVLSEAQSAEWTSFLQIFHTLKKLRNSDPEVDGPLNALMKWLCSNGIKEVNLQVSSLTESWAGRIINLIQECPSLEKVSLSAGFNTDAGGGFTGWVEYGPLEKDAINLLKESETKCIITISGISPYTREPVKDLSLHTRASGD